LGTPDLDLIKQVEQGTHGTGARARQGIIFFSRALAAIGVAALFWYDRLLDENTASGIGE
jgi:hypothetical protein